MLERKKLLVCGCLLTTSAMAAGCAEDDAASSTTAAASATTEVPATSADSSAASSRILALGGNPKTPGCAAAVGHDGEVVWTDEVGLASTTRKDPITSSTVFDIGSVSKQFTAAAVLELVIDDEVSLQDHLDRYFPDFPGWAKEVTVFDLIHHQSGVPEYMDLLTEAGYTDSDVTTQSQAVEALSTVQGLEFAPGSTFEYNDSNYILLADIVAIASDQEFARYVEETIFSPLGLKMTVDPGPDVPNKATSYNYEDDEWTDATSAWLQVGDGAIQTTPSELVRWADNYRTGQFGGQELLNLQLDNAVPVDPGTPDAGVYGGGIFLGPNGRLFHTGFWEGFYSMFVISSDRHHAVAMTCNHLPGGKDNPLLLQTMGETILDEWAGPNR